MQTVNCGPPAVSRERGGVLIAIVLLLVPLVLIVSGYTSSMGGRMGRLQMEVEDERALLAAESGVDEVLFRARNGDLDESPFKRELGPDYVFTVEPTRLGADRSDANVESRRTVTLGAISASPSAAARTACASSGGPASFSKNPRAPACSAP